MITTLSKDASFEPAETGSATVIEFTLETTDGDLDFRLGAADGPARLADLVPVAQEICTVITEATCETTAGSGHPVTCQKGCGACCKYLVALSPPEVDYLQQTLSRMNAKSHRAVLASCLDAAQKILDHHADIGRIDEHTGVETLNRWYAALDLDCPFLSNGICGIYANRPLACREHLVTSPASVCRISQTQTPQTLHLPVSLAEVLTHLAADLLDSEPEAVILPLALIQPHATPAGPIQTFNAVEMTERFAAILTQTANEKPEVLSAAR